MPKFTGVPKFTGALWGAIALLTSYLMLNTDCGRKSAFADILSEAIW